MFPRQGKGAFSPLSLVRLVVICKTRDTALISKILQLVERETSLLFGFKLEADVRPLLNLVVLAVTRPDR